MRKLATLLVAILFVLAVHGSTQTITPYTLLPSGIAVSAGATETNGTDFNSLHRQVYFPGQEVCGMVATFTRAAGSTSTVDFDFEVSYDNGTTWATLSGGTFSIATEHGVISGTTVRVYKLFNHYGMYTHIRLAKVTNNDVSNALTAVNVSVIIKAATPS